MRTCAICGASLPDHLRHGAMYCPHGRCKTQAYRSRKKESAQRNAAQKEYAAAPTASAEPTATFLSTELLQQACAASPGAPQIFLHSLACSCGQRFTVQILISHDRAIDQSLNELSAPIAASQVVQETAGATRAQPAMAPPSAIWTRTGETNIESPMESLAPALELDGSPVRPASAELHPMAPESSVVAAAEPILAHGSPAETSRAGADQGNLVDPAISPSCIESESDRPEVVVQASQECSVKDIAPSSEPRAAGSTKTPSESGASASTPQPSVAQPVKSIGGEFWAQVKENPTQAMGAFYRLLELGHSTNDQALVERAHCGLALVYALRGDGPHAFERLDRARMAAMKRGHTAEVGEVAEMVDKLFSASNPRRRSVDD